MAKAIVCIGDTGIDGTTPIISYTVTVVGPPTYSYSADYRVDTGITVNNNLIAWRNKIISQAAERGVALSVSDVIVFGAPS